MLLSVLLMVLIYDNCEEERNGQSTTAESGPSVGMPAWLKTSGLSLRHNFNSVLFWHQLFHPIMSRNVLSLHLSDRTIPSGPIDYRLWYLKLPQNISLSRVAVFQQTSLVTFDNVLQRTRAGSVGVKGNLPSQQ